MILKKELIKIGIEATDADDAILKCAQCFVDEGFAKDAFPQGVADREVIFATGLPGAGVDVAIPHADGIHALEPAVGIATLASDVPFRMMGDPSSVLHPKILFTLCLPEPSAQLTCLQKIMGILNDGELLASCASAATPDEVFALMSPLLG